MNFYFVATVLITGSLAFGVGNADVADTNTDGLNSNKTVNDDVNRHIRCAVHGQNFNNSEACEAACKTECKRPECTDFMRCIPIGWKGEFICQCLTNSIFSTEKQR